MTGTEIENIPSEKKNTERKMYIQQVSFIDQCTVFGRGRFKTTARNIGKGVYLGELLAPGFRCTSTSRRKTPPRITVQESIGIAEPNLPCFLQ